MAKLRRNQTYYPGRPLFPRLRPFVKPSAIPYDLIDSAYELISGELVNVEQYRQGCFLQAYYTDQAGITRKGLWDEAGASMLPKSHEFARPLQIRADFFERYSDFIVTLEDENS